MGLMWYNDYLSDFNEDFMKNYHENSDKGYFLEVDVEYPKKYEVLIKTCHFYLNEKELEKVEKLFCSIEDRKVGHTHKSFKTSIK